MKSILVLFSLSIFSIFSTKPSSTYILQFNPNVAIENMKWLIGTWKNITTRGNIYETWIQINESEFFGKSYAVKGKDTIVFETVKLIQKEDALLYIPTVRNQNDGKAVVFKCTYISSSKMIVEAPEHDYPQKISYTRIGKDQLVAEISGLKDGIIRYQTFSMKRNFASKNVELARRVFKFFNEHNWSKMAKLYADPAEFKDPSFGTAIVLQTRNEIIDKYEGMERMSPDIMDDIIAVYPSGDQQVIVEFVSSGTAPDGSKWRLPIVTIFTIEDGLIVKDFTYYDNQ